MISTTNRRWSLLSRCFALVMLLIVPAFFAARLNAQNDTAQIQGSVADSSGAVIAGATITLTNVDTAAQLTATSDAGGSFAFNALVRGHYTARITANGFETEVQDLTLDVSAIAGPQLQAEGRSGDYNGDGHWSRSAGTN